MPQQTLIKSLLLLVCAASVGHHQVTAITRESLTQLNAFDDFYDDFDDDDWAYGGRAVAAATTVAADDCGGATTKTTTTAKTTTTKKVATRVGNGLCQEFVALRNVLPMRTLVRITANRYRRDAKFRHAMNFLQSGQFQHAAEQIEDSDAYQRLLLRFEDAGVNIADLESIARIFDCLLLPLVEIGGSLDWGNNSAQPMSAARASTSGRGKGGLAGYAQDVWHAVPRRAFETAVKEHLQKNPEFNSFYRVMRTVGLRQDIIRTLALPEISDAVRLLRRNFIDLRQLLLLASRIFAAGPSP